MKPREEDLSKIHQFYQEFCRYKNISYNFIKEPRARYSRKKTELIRIFLGAMIHLYMPETFIVKKITPLTYGFLTAIGKVTDKTKFKLSEEVNKVITMERVYPDFKGEVELFLSHLNTVTIYYAHQK